MLSKNTETRKAEGR